MQSWCDLFLYAAAKWSQYETLALSIRAPQQAGITSVRLFVPRDRPLCVLLKLYQLRQPCALCIWTPLTLSERNGLLNIHLSDTPMR